MMVLRAELQNHIAASRECYVEISSRDVVMQRYHDRDSMMSKIDQHGALPCKDIKDTVCVPGQKSSVILKDLTCAILWYVIQGY